MSQKSNKPNTAFKARTPRLSVINLLEVPAINGAIMKYISTQIRSEYRVKIAYTTIRQIVCNQSPGSSGH